MSNDSTKQIFVMPPPASSAASEIEADVRLPNQLPSYQGVDFHLLIDATKTLFGSIIFVIDGGGRRMGASEERPCGCSARSKDNGHSSQKECDRNDKLHCVGHLKDSGGEL